MSFRAASKTPVRTLAGLTLAASSIFAAPSFADGHAADRLTPIQATLDAHGGLDTWQAQRTYTYKLTGFPLSEPMSRPNVSTADLHRRWHRIDGDGFTAGWNGEEAWSTGEPNSSGLPSRFVTLGSFYFLGMPFVFADPGSIISERPDTVFEGVAYRTVAVGYDDGTGQSSADDYVLLIDKQTDILFGIHHSVTETGIERVTWIFNDWQESDGLLAPKTLTFYPGWNPDSPGVSGAGAVTQVTELDFDTQAPDAALYRVPEGATVDAVAE